jgi:hypothetical protein
MLNNGLLDSTEEIQESRIIWRLNNAVNSDYRSAGEDG